MAQLLASRYSVERCLGIVRRHQRLCKQVVNDTTLVSQIEPMMELCKSKEKLRKGKNEAREDAYDDLILSKKSLEDEIRSIFSSCQQYDRDHPGALTLEKIFPAGKFSNIFRLPFDRELAEVDKILLRLKGLGEEHSLFSNSSKIKLKSAAMAKALEGHLEFVRIEKLAWTEVVISREALIRQYEFNYFDARRKYGKSMCEKLFPMINKHKRSPE